MRRLLHDASSRGSIGAEQLASELAIISSPRSPVVRQSSPLTTRRAKPPHPRGGRADHGGGGAFQGEAPIQGGAARTRLSRQFSAAPAKNAASPIVATGSANHGPRTRARCALRRRKRPFRTARRRITMSDKVALSDTYIITFFCCYMISNAKLSLPEPVTNFARFITSMPSRILTDRSGLSGPISASGMGAEPIHGRGRSPARSGRVGRTSTRSHYIAAPNLPLQPDAQRQPRVAALA